MLQKGYAVVIFDEHGMPRCVGVGANDDDVNSLIIDNVGDRDLRAHVYPLPKTKGSIRVYKYKKGINNTR